MGFHWRFRFCLVFFVSGLWLISCAPQPHVWTAQEVFDHLEAQGLEITNPTTDISSLPATIGSDLPTNCRERVIFQILDVQNNQIFVCDTPEEMGEIGLYLLQSVEPVPTLIDNSNAQVVLVLNPDLNQETAHLYEVALATLGMRYIYE